MQLSETNFTVHERALAFVPLGANRMPIKFSGHKALIRNINNEPRVLTVVKDSYYVVQNSDLFNAVTREMCAAFGDNAVADAKLTERVADHGAWCMWDVTFPSIKRPILYGTGGGTEVGFRTVVINSFDGSTSVKAYVGAIDFFCTNGLIRGEYEQAVFRHNSNTILSRFSDRLKIMMQVFDKDIDIMRDWAKRDVTLTRVQAWLDKQVDAGRLTKAKADAIALRFMQEAEVRGATVWALYSALIYYATYQEGTVFAPRGDGAARPRLAFKREQDVHQLTSTQDWKELAA
jgi:hypothetical protein